MNGIQPSGFQCLKGEARVAEVEAAETQVWLEYSVKCEYLSQENGLRLHKMVDQIIGKLVTTGNNPSPCRLDLQKRMSVSVTF